MRVKAANSVFENIVNSEILDPKWVYKPKDYIEIRTFCMCQDGEIVLGKYESLKSYSGRADCYPTWETNFGLNVRVKAEKKINFDLIVKSEKFCFNLDTILNDVENKLLSNYYGSEGANYLKQGLVQLTEQFLLNSRRENFNKIELIGPTIEGIGKYPDIGEDLKIKDENIYVIGDATGIFRGIISSMLSGFYVSNIF